MNLLGGGLKDAKRHEEGLFVREAQLSTMRRLGAPECDILVVQANLASAYYELGRYEDAVRIERDVYSGRLKLFGEENEATLRTAVNYTRSLGELRRLKEAKSLLRKTIPVARRVLGENHEVTLRMRQMYALSLYKDPAATLDDLREAVTTLEETERTARRVFGNTHPHTKGIVWRLRRCLLYTSPSPRDS